MLKLNAAIIGAGQIGAFFDAPGSKSALTHAHAYNLHHGFEIVGFVDTNYSKAQKAAKMWGGRAYKRIDDLFKKESIDVVSLCVPDEFHYDACQELKKYNLRGGILEKPLADKLNESYGISLDKFFTDKKFLVNYHRRYVPEFQELEAKIKSGAYGRLVAGNAYYGKGTLHNASHLLDLLLFFGFQAIDSKVFLEVNDFYRNDPSCSFVLFLKQGGVFSFNAVPAKLYKIIEMDFCFEKARLRILDGGLFIEEYLIESDKFFKGYKIPVLAKKVRTKLTRALYFSVDNLYNAITKNKAILCTVKDGYSVHKLCEEIKKKSAQEKK